MQYLYAALLLHKAGNEITTDAVTAVLEAAGVDVDESRVKTLVAAVGEIDIEEAIASASMMAVAAPAGPAGMSNRGSPVVPSDAWAAACTPLSAVARSNAS